MVDTYSSKGKGTVSISIEHGMVKLIASQGQVIDGYRVTLANPRFFKEGHVSNSSRVAGLLEGMLSQLNGKIKFANVVVPGFQNRLRVMEFPKGQGFDPRKVIAQEASRTMHVTGAGCPTVSTGPGGWCWQPCAGPSFPFWAPFRGRIYGYQVWNSGPSLWPGQLINLKP